MPTLKKLEDVAARRLGLLLIKYEREAAAVLSDALKEVRNTLTKIYDKYAVDGVLTKAQMTQYNRLTNLEAEITKNIKPSLNKVVALTKRLPAEVYQQSFFQHAWAMDGSQGVRLKWGTLNMGAILKNTENPMDKIIISKDLESQIGTLAAEMMRDEAIAGAKIALNNGLPLGKSYTAMARDLKKSINTTAARALRIIRTEGQTAMNSGQDAAYYKAEKAGVEGRYIWDATLDGRTRREHGDMDQKARNEKTGLFAGPGSEVSRYPADMNLSAGNRINCRCRLRFEVEGFSPLIRRTREKGLVPYQSYTDYATEYHPEWLK